MGEIAEMMLDGTLCQMCGVYIRKPSDGVPRFCKACQREENIERSAAEQVAAKKHPCPTCGKKLRLVGVADHQRDAHGVMPLGYMQGRGAA